MDAGEIFWRTLLGSVAVALDMWPLWLMLIVVGVLALALGGSSRR
jgi:hypothetical protein